MRQLPQAVSSNRVDKQLGTLGAAAIAEISKDLCHHQLDRGLDRSDGAPLVVLECNSGWRPRAPASGRINLTMVDLRSRDDEGHVPNHLSRASTSPCAFDRRTAIER
jgi:hypothetical protein